MSVSTTHRRPCQDSSISTCRASCADRLGRNPKLHGRKPASKTGSSTIFTAACTIRSRTAAIASGLRSCCPAWGSVPAARAADATFPLAEQPGHPVLLDVSQGGLVDARRAIVAAHRIPRPLQDVLAVDLVSQRMKPPVRIGLGRPVQRMLKRSDSVPSDSRQGGPSRILGTHQSAAPSLRVNEAAALPITAGCVVLRLDRYYDRLRLPPGTTPASRLHTGYKARPFRGHREPAPAGEGLPSSRRHHLNVPRPLTPGSPSRPHLQDLRRFHGLHREPPGSALPQCLTTRQASLHATDRSVAPTTVAFDAGL